MCDARRGDRMQNILIADDDAAIRGVLRDLLEDEGFDVDEVDSAQGVVDALAENGKTRPGLVMMDVRMPDRSGLDVLRETRSTNGEQLPIIVMTAYGTSNVAIEAMQLGAYDYLTKPFDLDDVLLTIQRFFEHQRLSEQVMELSSRLGERDPNDVIIGNSAALQETLLESELFGHEKGAFTGAINQRKGRFEMANKGTIFLDEVGEMSLATQKKLLRVLQEREFERVGGTVSVKVDTRVVAATNKILAQEIEAGRFREDLFYRMNVIAIHLPALRDRMDDIPLLVEHFVQKHRFTPGSEPSRLSQGAMNALMEYDWPGNVRELENLIERATVLAQGGVITEQHIN